MARGGAVASTPEDSPAVSSSVPFSVSPASSVLSSAHSSSQGQGAGALASGSADQGNAVCPYDPAHQHTLRCRCTHNCTTAATCNKSHHTLYSGTVKDVIFGISAPCLLQRALAAALDKMPEDMQVVTIIVNSDRHAEAMRGEVWTLLQIDRVDPCGDFTAKLIFQHIVSGRRTRSHNSGHVADTRRILRKLRLEDNGASGAAGADPCKLLLHPPEHECDCARCQYTRLRKQMRMWTSTAPDLHYIYMQYAGRDIHTLKVGTTVPCTAFVAGCQRLLTNYVKLYENKICHLDLHEGNLTWAYDASAHNARLDLKFIDFGFNRMFDSTEPRGNSCPDCGAIDVTKYFMQICNLFTEPLRSWHPVEYPMFHLCTSLLLAPLLLAAVPNATWTRAHHNARVKRLAALTLSASAREVARFGHIDAACTAFFATCPLDHNDPDSPPCARHDFAHDLGELWHDIQHTYANVRRHLLPVWTRVCAIVGAEIALVHFEADGTAKPLPNLDARLCHGGDAFTHSDAYSHLFDVFRTEFYYCQELDLRTVQREFDTFSLATMMLEKLPTQETALREDVHRHLLHSDSYESNKTRLHNFAAGGASRAL